MRKSWYKISGGVAALCLLCCAAPLTALFVGGGAVAGSGLLPAMGTEGKYLALAAGVTAMAVAAYLIWRHSQSCRSCLVPKS